jgi:MSHA pilin protein MshD
MNNARQTGFTLIELILFIVVVSIGVVGILSVMNFTVQHSADPMVRMQAATLADSIMEEILLKEYADPDGGANVVEAGRSTYDDVDDYNGLTQTAFTDLPAILQGYQISIAISDGTAALGVTAKQISVTVASGNESISMTAYRANY